jgi:hypothetical protein
MAANEHDATLVVQLLQWATQMGIADAEAKVLADSFDPDKAVATEKPAQTILFFGEAVGTLVKRRLLDRELATDLWWIEGMWARVGPCVVKLRERLGEPRLYENFEALAESVAE